MNHTGASFRAHDSRNSHTPGHRLLQRRERKLADEPVVRELRLLQAFPDGAEHHPFARPQPTLHDVLTRIWDATDDENVKGLFVRVGALQGAWGSVGDLVEALGEFRAENRPSIATSRPQTTSATCSSHPRATGSACRRPARSI